MDFMHSGHRGAMRLAPENTMASFMMAAEYGVTELELDLRLSKDGVLMIIHDATVDRTTSGAGAVADLTVDQLRELDAGDGEQIPTFDEVLAGTELPLMVEMKDAYVVEPFLDLVANRPELLPRMSPCSFSTEIVATLAARLPSSVMVGLISRSASVETLQRAMDAGVQRALLGWSGVDGPLIAHAHELGLHYGIWPVNTPEQLLRAVALGVDGIVTDDPRVVIQNGYEVHEGALARRAG